MAREERKLDDMTECSICTEVFTDPRVLPCSHTFCLKCLLNYGKDKQPGDTMPCPLCRKEFTIPDGGFTGTQKNFFVQKLLYARKLSAGEYAEILPCDACSCEETRDEGYKLATMYCVQCAQNYCDQCSRIHGKMNAAADHVQMAIGKALETNQIEMKLPPTTCATHKGKEIQVFCQDCKLAVCVLCFIDSHHSHTCCDVEDVSTNLILNREVRDDTEQVTEILKKAGELLPCFEVKKKYLISHLEDIERQINAAAYRMIDEIQENRKKLLSEVETIRLKRMKELETVKEELERHIAALESFKRYSETLLSSGTACDVVRSAKSLHDRADDLIELDMISQVQSSIVSACSANVKFCRRSLLAANKGDNSVGKIIEDEGVTKTGLVVGPQSISDRFDSSGLFSFGRPWLSAGQAPGQPSGVNLNPPDLARLVVPQSSKSLTAFSWPKQQQSQKTSGRKFSHKP